MNLVINLLSRTIINMLFIIITSLVDREVLTEADRTRFMRVHSEPSAARAV